LKPKTSKRHLCGVGCLNIEQRRETTTFGKRQSGKEGRLTKKILYKGVEAVRKNPGNNEAVEEGKTSHSRKRKACVKTPSEPAVRRRAPGEKCTERQISSLESTKQFQRGKFTREQGEQS